jgi:hypothetical protein
MNLNRVLCALRRHSLPASAFAVSLTLGGCTSVPSNTCAKAADVTGCVGASTGYSCTGSDAPQDSDTSLSCGAGVREPSGVTAYCCIDATVATCGADPTVTCASGSSGYSCSGTDSPAANNSSLTCGAGVPAANGATTYCCANVTPCAADTTVDCSTVVSAGVTGYTCTSGEPDSANSSLRCVQAPNGTESQFCCSPNGICSLEFSATALCSGSAPNGYVCTGTVVPSALTCGSGIAGTEGTTIFCCSK